MRQVVLRAVFLLRRPRVIVTGLLVALGGAFLVRLPLLGMPGFELSLVLSVVIGLLGGISGASAAFLERRLIQGRDPRPKNAVRFDNAAAATFHAVAAGTLLNLVFLAIPLLAATLFAAASTACDPFEHIGFVPLLPGMSALMAAAAGAFCAFASRGKTGATLLYLALLIGSGVMTAWPIVMGPQVYAYNHFLGAMPGPIYDEAISVTPALGWFRVETALIAALLWLLAAITLDMREGRLGRPRARIGPWVLLGSFVLCLVALEERAPGLGFRMSNEALTEALGGVRESDHFVVTYPRGKDKLQLDRLMRDLEFRYQQLSAFLGGAPDGRIRVFVYRNGDEKRRLVGASRTQFAKPWRLELHINDDGFPHGVMKHELAHVLAAPLGSGPFGVTTRYGLLPVMGIIEGLAVAADDPVDELTLHQWAAGMRKEKLAPDLREILGPRGFYKNAPARAYTLVGSFLRYLADTYGTEKLRAVYARGDFESAYGRTLDSLATEWEKFLDTVAIAPAQLSQAFVRFRQPSIFVRACAREVASTYANATQALASDPAAALTGFVRCSELQPDEPSYKLGQADALTRLDRGGEAMKLLDSVAKGASAQPALEAEVLLAEADVAVTLGKKDEAAALLQRVLGLATSAAVERTARIKLAAFGSTVAAPAVTAYFKSGADELRLLRLREVLDQEPQNSALSYLLGRRLVQVGEPALGARYLARALDNPELPDSIKRESLRMRAEALYEAGDCAGVKDLAGKLPDLGEVLSRQVNEWAARCDFEQRTFQGALVPPGGFR